MDANPKSAEGSHGQYRWLISHELELAQLLQKCPQLVLGKHVAITSIDSGSLYPTDERKGDGWRFQDDIAYSPQVRLADSLPTDGFDEWYVFNAPQNLGKIWRGNIFESPLTPGVVSVLVNFGDGFSLHRTDSEPLTSIFWKQMDWIQPETYLADTHTMLTIVTRDVEILGDVRSALI